MKLLKPCKKYEKDYYMLVNSAIKNNDVKELGNAYRENESYNDFLSRVKNREKGINISKMDVPSSTYFIINDENRLVGTIDLRHTLNDNYYYRLGHIAYYIKKEERNKGYAAESLKLALKIYQKHNINEVLITCLSDNIASKKVIIKNGGVFEKRFFEKSFNSYIDRYWIFISKKQDIIPNTVWLTTNMVCNNNCKWCYAKKHLNNGTEMVYNDILNYVNYLKKQGVKKIILIGGEPTIHPEILNIIKTINENNIYVSMATNGRKFSDYNFAKQASLNGLKSINISIKGYDEDTYMSNTNNFGFEEMINGYKNAIDCGINTSLSYVICDTDHKKFDKFWNAVKIHGLNNILFQLYKPSVDDNSNPISIEELADMCKYVYDKIYKDNIDFVFEMSIPLCTLDENMLNHMIAKKRIITCCHIYKGTGMVFDSNFNILPCNHFMGHALNNEKININNVIKFWNSSDPKEFRSLIKKYPSEICSRCKKWYQCGGGCPIRWMTLNPNDIINEKYVYVKEVQNDSIRISEE